MPIDKSWIDDPSRRFSVEYRTGAKAFLEYTKNMVDSAGKIPCPCKKCNNMRSILHPLVYEHIIQFAFKPNYKTWIYHGEYLKDFPPPVSTIDCSATPSTVGSSTDNLGGFLNDVFRGIEGNSTGESGSSIPVDDDLELSDDEEDGRDQTFSEDVSKLFADLERELYPGCKEFTVLSFVVHLMNLKVNNKWTNTSFDSLMSMMSKLFRYANLPDTYYKAKQYLRSLGLGYQSIHVCKYDCALFWREHEKLNHCPVCGTSRWVDENSTTRKLPHKCLRYFPITPRLRRLFCAKETAQDMIWHEAKRQKTPGVLRHPADGEAWRHFDRLYPDFAADPRNVRLGLSTDGFNPFGTMSNAYSMWPVLLFPYNMSPWKCMSEISFLMPLLIPGRHSPGKDIDVFLQPLIQELKHLWSTGVDVFDANLKKNFTLRAALMWTVHDFPAYGYVSGWNTMGYKACPTCNEETSCVRISDKLAYDGHRRFLPQNHTWRKNKGFNGSTELRSEPKKLTGDDILKQLRHVPDRPLGKHLDFGLKKRKRDPRELNWTRKSILFQLPYWHKLLLRHNLDVMHVEKNIFDNIVGTLLDIPGKSKDTEKSRRDLMKMKIRPELWLHEENGRLKKPRASYVLPLEKRRDFCKFLKSVRFPDGIASNILHNVREKEGIVTGLKTHDCHMLLHRILPMGVRAFVPSSIADTLAELGRFFRSITARTLHVSELERMKEDVVIILCKLEKIYPPSFLTVMVHLMVHLPDEALLGGPVPYRWMYRVERRLGTLKKYVRNRARPEGSIAEGYCVDEALQFCTRYLRDDVRTIHNRPDRYHDPTTMADEEKYSLDLFNPVGRSVGKKNLITLSENVLAKATWFCLTNCPEVQKYLE